MTDQDPIDEFIALPRDQQLSTLQQLAPEKQDKLLGQIKTRRTKNLTANDKGEGLYRMLPSSQQGYTDTSKELQVPYSRVKDVQNNGYKLHPDEESRYEKDSTHEGQGPSFIERAKTGIQNALAPSTGITGQIPILPGLDLNALKAAGRTVAGVPEYLGQVLSAAKDVATGQSDGEDLIDLIDPAKMPEGLYKQYQEDYKKDPKTAADNLVGSIAGMGIVAAVTHGAPKLIRSVPKPGLESLRGGIRDTLGVTENTEKTVKKFGVDSEAAREHNKGATEKTIKQRGAVDKSNKTAAEKHADLVQAHNKEVARIAKEHRENVAKQTQEHADALQKHQDETKATQAKNVKALQEHLESAGKIAKDNQAAEDSIKARRAAEQQLTQDTTDFRQRIAAAEQKAEADNNAAWDGVRKATAGQETDIGPLKKTVEVAKAQADPASSPLFRSILNEGEGGGFDDQGRPLIGGQPRIITIDGREVPVTDPHYAEYYEKMNGEPPPLGGLGGKTDFARLQRWYTYISSKMYGGGRLEAGTYNALKMTRNAINDAMKDITKQVGNVPDPLDPNKTVSATSLLDNARKLHTEKMEAFSDSPNEPATVASAYEKKIVPESVKETTEAEWGKKLERYDPEIPKIAESITKAKEGLKNLPKEDEARKAVKPLPAPPISTPLPTPPVAPEPLPGPQYPIPPVLNDPAAYKEPVATRPLPDAPNIQEENLRHINEGLRRYGKVGGWVLRTIVGGAALGLSHGNLSVFGENMLLGQGAVTLLTKALRSPSMLDWLSKPSAEDIKTINTLPPADAARMRQALSALANEEKRTNPNAKTKIAPAMAAFLAGGSATQENKKKNPQDLIDEWNSNHPDQQINAPPPGPQSSTKSMSPRELLAQAQELQSSFHRAGVSPSAS